MKVGEEGDYIPIATVTTRMTSALRWAAMRAILMFQMVCRMSMHGMEAANTKFMNPPARPVH